ncbi:MAG: carboxypeptidase regulatory-like domain-containing protein [Acidobacteria bacterium]|nr:carboxypeptidase regulatory-like domain-containing protein [Acidobacteriota bacterium]
MDMGEGRISSVRYNSIAPLAERLKSLRLPFGEQVTRAEFLYAMRGARVEVRSGSSSAAGKLLSVESLRKQDGKGNLIDVTAISVMTDGGEMRNFELGDGTSVRLAEKDLNEEVSRYLSLISSSRARDVRRMTLTASGSGDRDVFVSYISEVPVWKSTYRIIFPEKEGEKPLLQGWAIVDNTIGEDWKDVQLSLVAGAPQSFIQDISQPFYARRPVIPLPQSALLTPQSHEATIESKSVEGLALLTPGVLGKGMAITSLEGTVKDQTGATISGARVTVRNEETGASQVSTTDAHGHYRLDNIQAGNSALFVNAPGFSRFELTNFYLGVGRSNEIDATLQVGNVSEAVTVNGAPVTLNTESASVSALASRQGAEAEGKSAGDFFLYDVKQKITIGRNQSALVPILHSHIEAEKVTIWEENSPPLRALWIKNTSGQVLDAGTFNVLQADQFAGEGVMDAIHPDERRLLSYAADPSIQVKYQTESSEKPYSRVKIAKGVLIAMSEEHSVKKYKVHNADSSSRQVIVEYPAEDNWSLTKETQKPEESTASFHRFRVVVEAGKTSELTVESVHPQEARFELDDLDSDQVKLLAEQKRVTPAMQQAFDRILARKNKVDELDSQLAQRKQENDQIAADQNRIRENMKALKGSAEERALVQRYTKQLDAQEDRLSAIRKETEDLRARKNQASDELTRMVLEINMDESF